MIDTKKITVSPLELKSEILTRTTTNRKRGADLHWSNANEFMSLKKGYPIFIAGVGGVGKTEIILDIMLNASFMHGWKWLILSPEMGNAEEILEQIIEKISKGKTLEAGKENSLTKEQITTLIAWAHKHFRILDPMREWKASLKDMALNIENFFQVVKAEEEKLRGKFDGVLIDPFNELDIDMGGAKTAMTVKNELDALLWWTRKQNYCTILTNHVNDKQEIRSKDANDNVYMWTPPAKKEEWAYGQQFGRKGYQMLLIYQPHPVKIDEEANEGNIECQHAQRHFYNMREVYVQKTKPKGVGKTGKFRIFFDRGTQRYYNLDEQGNQKAVYFPKI
jgi:hypothetical protein